MFVKNCVYWRKRKTNDLRKETTTNEWWDVGIDHPCGNFNRKAKSCQNIWRENYESSVTNRTMYIVKCATIETCIATPSFPSRNIFLLHSRKRKMFSVEDFQKCFKRFWMKRLRNNDFYFILSRDIQYSAKSIIFSIYRQDVHVIIKWDLCNTWLFWYSINKYPYSDLFSEGKLTTTWLANTF